MLMTVMAPMTRSDRLHTKVRVDREPTAVATIIMARRA